MSDDPAVNVDQLTLFHSTRRDAAIDRADEARRRDAAARGTLAAGARVLDTITGLYGIVEPTPAPSLSGSALLSVRLERGDTVIRRPEQLFERPTPPRV